MAVVQGVPEQFDVFEQRDIVQSLVGGPKITL